jgi:hypothetical protein
MTSRVRDKEERTKLVAERIRSLGLGAPAAVLLDAGRPLALVAAQLMWLGQPLLGLMFPSHEVAAAARVLEDPESVNALIELLDREPGEYGGPI